MKQQKAPIPKPSQRQPSKEAIEIAAEIMTNRAIRLAQERQQAQKKA